MSRFETIDVTRFRGKGVKKLSAPTIRIKRDLESEKKNMDLLYACFNDYEQFRSRRMEHLRFMRYLNGDQWGDLVADPDNQGKMITERELYRRTGVTPVTHNILQQYIRNVCGQMLSNKYKTIVVARREEDSQAAEMMTNAIQACLLANENDTIDINVIVALHTLGMAWGKITYTAWDERNCTDGRIDFVNEQRISWNQDTEDPRMFDIRRICELHSYTLEEIIANFANNKADERLICKLYEELYQSKRDNRERDTQKATDVLHSLDFWGNANEPNKYRVMEVWSKRGRWVLWTNDRGTFSRPKEYIYDIEKVEAEINEVNAMRIANGLASGMEMDDIPLIECERHYEQYWLCQFLTPQGVCLKEMESPYDHHQHPYVIASMPIIDAESKPLFSDLIEMQRNINRQRTILDMLVASSAKNTLFIPEDALEGHSIDEYAEQLMKINGVIVYRAKAGQTQLPEFMQRNSVNLGVFELLNYDMQQIQQISGLSGAIQGQVAKSNMPASLYAQQAQNTMLNFVLLFDRFQSYCQKRDMKLSKVLIQYYTAPRYIAIAGKAYGDTATEYTPELAATIADNYALVPTQGMDTPIFRDMVNNYLMEMLKGGLIPLETFLGHTTLPFGKQILAEIQSLKQQQEQGQPMDMGKVDNLQQIAASQSSPQAMAVLNQMMGGGQPMGESGIPVPMEAQMAQA